MTMRLKRAVAGDQMLVEEFQKTAYARTEAKTGAAAIPLEWDYRAIMHDCEVWLNERDGVLAGVLILRLLDDRLILESIATAPEVSGSGIGADLLAAAFERARVLDRNKIGLITNSRNPAAGWYMKMGFVVHFEEVQDSRTVLHMQAATTGVA